MKKLSISMFALAAIAFSACTSDDIALNDNASNVATGGDGYISVAINLPTQASTRAANDVYDDGLAVEYAVNDATLLLFEGTSEDNAVCYETYSLAASFTLYTEDDDPNTGNITSREQITQKIDSPVSGNLYAMVILNDNGMEQAVGGYIGKSLEALQTTAVTLEGGASAIASSTTGFYMCNAPLINTPGGTTDPSTGTVSTLALIDANKIYASQALAEANPATEIYVERGMAKVTMSTDASMATSLTIGDQELTVTVDGFALDQTNNVTYPVRNTHTADAWWGYASGSSAVSTTDKYRFAGSVVVGTTTTGTETTPTNLYRTYWALDPNYDVAPYTEDASGNKTYSGMTSIVDNFPTTLTAADGETPAYCLENTFNVAHQNQDETTRAIVKVTLGEADFYIWDGNKSLLYKKQDILDLAETVFSEVPAVEAALDPETSYISTNEFFSTYVTVSLKEEGASDDAEFEITITGLSGEEFKDGQVPEVFGDGLQAVVEELNEAHTIGYYQGGVNYYSVLIKHFGDDLTPWNLETVTGAESTYTPDPDNYNTSYPGGIWNTDADNNWLGRYGVLRNNWYDVNITAITGVGSATPPEATGIPDDPTEQWISVRINILSWAKRTQNVQL